jgi:hypothetical protein
LSPGRKTIIFGCIYDFSGYTPQDKERLKITPLIQENQDKEQHRRATTSHRKAIPKEHEWDYREWEHDCAFEDYDDVVEACCRYSLPSSITTPVYFARRVHGRMDEYSAK